jgi:hypothetical protein
MLFLGLVGRAAGGQAFLEHGRPRELRRSQPNYYSQWAEKREYGKNPKASQRVENGPFPSQS